MPQSRNLHFCNHVLIMPCHLPVSALRSANSIYSAGVCWRASSDGSVRARVTQWWQAQSEQCNTKHKRVKGGLYPQAVRQYCVHCTGKKTPGEPRTRTGHTGAHRAHGTHRQTSQPSKPNRHTRTAHDHATAETARGSTSAGPEPTAPRGRLRRGRPQRTRPCIHPLPERLPAPARRLSAKRRRARQMRNGRRSGQSPR